MEQGNSSNHERVDAVVIGGGPAGSTVATLVAREGARRVVLLDRESFPRFRIGESLMPATYWTLKRLGVLESLQCSHFTKKYSVQFYSPKGRGSAPFYFTEIDTGENSQTWQVVRSEFDTMLLEHSAASGVDVRQRANVADVVFEGGRARGVIYDDAAGVRRRIDCDVVVDATGQTALLGRKLKLKAVDPKLRHMSYFTRYKGARRDAGIDAGATLILQTAGGESWFWYIPLPDDIVSVGVVGPVDYLAGARPGKPAEIFAEEIERCAALQPRLAGAEQLEPVEALRDFSYVSRKIAGDGWVLAGDAFGFLDPIYSTGVFLALQSAEFAADSILDAFAHRDFSATRLGQHGERYIAGMEKMRKLVYAYYDQSFSIGEFVKTHPECREPLVNLLVGNVFRVPSDSLFEKMAQFVDLPEARSLESIEGVS